MSSLTLPSSGRGTSVSSLLSSSSSPGRGTSVLSSLSSPSPGRGTSVPSSLSLLSSGRESSVLLSLSLPGSGSSETLPLFPEPLPSGMDVSDPPVDPLVSDPVLSSEVFRGVASAAETFCMVFMISNVFPVSGTDVSASDGSDASACISVFCVPEGVFSFSCAHAV